MRSGINTDEKTLQETEKELAYYIEQNRSLSLHTNHIFFLYTEMSYRWWSATSSICHCIYSKEIRTKVAS